MSAIVWFSGPSAINLVDVVPYGVYEEYATNHFDEFRSVDHICAYDNQIVSRIEPKPHCQYHTQVKWSKPPWQALRWNPHEVAISDSGTLAIEVALATHHEVFVIGTDWGVTDVSVQDHHYEFRGWSPPKFIKQHEWLKQRGNSVIWVHLVKQPWMTHYMSHSDFLDLATSTRH